MHTHRYPPRRDGCAGAGASGVQRPDPHHRHVATAKRKASRWKTPSNACCSNPRRHTASPNKGTYPIHFYRIEFKRMDGNELMKKTHY